MTESIVYLVQEPPPVRRSNGPDILKDLSSAQRYGVVKPILSSSDQPSAAPGPALNRFTRELKDFRPQTDFVCFAGGDPMSLALCLLALSNMQFPHAYVLRWERERDTKGKRTGGGFYTPIICPLR